MASPEAQAVLDRMTGLNVNETFAIEQFVDTLVASGDWAHVYDVWSFALNVTDHLTGWKTNTFTPNGNVSHAVGTGVTLDDASSYLSLTVGPEDLRTWDGTGTSAGGWCLAATTGANADYFGSISGGGSEWYFRNRTANDIQAILGSTAGVSPRLTGVTHPFTDFYYARNTGSARYIRVGDATTSGADAITTPWATDPIHFPGRNSSGNQNGFASTHDFFFIGNGNLDDQAMKDAIVQFRLDLVNGPPLPPADAIIPYHPTRKYSVRPNRFRLAPDHPLSQGCVFAGLGSLAGSYHYHNSTVNHQHGILHSSKSPDDWRMYRGRNAIAVDGTTDNDVQCTNFTGVIGNAKPITMSAWLYIDTAEVRHLVSLSDPTSTAEDYVLGYRYGLAACYHRAEGRTSFNGQTSGVSVSTGWHHVVGVFTVGGGCQAWINGAQQSATGDDADTNVGNTPRVFIGGIGDLTEVWGQGIVADVLIHTRILPLAEILSLANSSDPMLDGWIQPLPTTTYSFPTEEPTPPPTGNVVVYHPTRKYSVRPNRFRLAPDHPLSDGCVFAGMGNVGGSKYYHNSSLRDYHGSLQNMGAENWVTANSRRALRFNGTNERVSLGTPAVLESLATGNGPIAISAWGYDTAGSNAIITSGQSRGGTNERGYDLFDTGSQFRAMVVSLSGNLITITTTTRPALNTWHHFCFTWDGTTNVNGAKLYIDGAIGAQGAAVSGTVGSGYDWSIAGQGGFQWNGQIQDVLIYNRVLSSAEIQSPLAAATSDPMLDGWIQPLPTITYSFGTEAPTPPTGRIHKIFRSSLIRGLRC